MTRKPGVAFVLISMAAALAAVRPAAGGGGAERFWPAWRGPLYSGVAPHGKPPVDWSETKNVKWKVELPGYGHSTPIVWGDRIYVQTAVPKEGQAPGAPAVHQFVVLALDRATGKTIWKKVVREEAPHESGHQTASQASASPVTDGERLYAFFGSRGLYCLDMDGAVKWEKDFGDMRTRNQFGEGSSPALHGDTIVVNWDQEADSFITALDKRTGEQRWKVARDERTSWSTPLVVDDGGRPLVVVSATNRVRAYDLKTGEEVWKTGGLGVNCIPSPVAEAGLIFVMSGYQEPAGMAIRYAGAKGDITGSDRMVWRVERGTSYVPSPLLYDGTLYFLERFRNVMSAIDLKTGKTHYTEQRLEGMGSIYASPAGADGRIYLVDRDGNGAVVRHGATFELLATSKLDDGFDASPVIVGDDLYLRGHRNLYCLSGQGAAPVATGSAGK